MTPKKNILIVDDHPLFREGIKAFLGSKGGFRIIGEAGNSREGLRLAKQLQPDLIIIDISLPDGNGLELTRAIIHIRPDARILILSVHCTIDYITEAFQAGATGYLVKKSASEDLLKCLAAVAKGDYFLDSSVFNGAFECLGNFPVKAAGGSGLTSREQNVLRLVAEGLSTKAISAKLGISPKTVESHRTNIKKKLGLQSTTDLLGHAAKLGLLKENFWSDAKS